MNTPERYYLVPVRASDPRVARYGKDSDVVTVNPDLPRIFDPAFGSGSDQAKEYERQLNGGRTWDDVYKEQWQASKPRPEWAERENADAEKSALAVIDSTYQVFFRPERIAIRFHGFTDWECNRIQS